MSLRAVPFPEIPVLTVQMARAAFPGGTLAMRLRDELGGVYESTDFLGAFACRGAPATSPGVLALVSVLQYAERLTDRQAADAVRGRIGWKYALGLELTDAGFEFSALSGFRSRVLGHGLEHQFLDVILARCAQLGLLRAGGRMRTDSTHVVACVRDLNRVEFVTETLRCALEALSVAAPDWLAGCGLVTSVWLERYGQRAGSCRLPKGDGPRAEFAAQAGSDGYASAGGDRPGRYPALAPPVARDRCPSHSVGAAFRPAPRRRRALPGGEGTSRRRAAPGQPARSRCALRGQAHHGLGRVQGPLHRNL
jgi:transposase